MQNKRSRLLPIVLGIGVLVIALCAIGLILLYPIGVRFVLDNYPIRGRPNSFDSPGPVLGRDRFERFQFAFSPLQESVTDLRWIEVNPQNEPLLAAVSNGGAVFFDEQGRKVHSVRFTSEAVRAQLILTGDDNQYGFLSRGTWGTPPSFVSRSGQEIWNHGAQRGVNDMATGDLTGDGKLDFAVGFNGFGGINLLDHNGATVWNVKG
ncbi:MAG: hypothetical protein KF858_14340, partial [Candidatus Sumerlaeia bacterium]|nr:hypothetical protein [Candidatus Sumerlaeia bacterium]